MRQISGVPLGPVLWLVTMFVMLGGFWYIVHRINQLSSRVGWITGRLIAHGLNLKPGRTNGGAMPKVPPTDPDDLPGKHGIL